MPSREDIVEWLREAAEHREQMGYKHLKNYFLKRAAQVAAMRCETCARRVVPPYCDALGINAPKDFGCFLHEQK